MAGCLIIELERKDWDKTDVRLFLNELIKKRIL